MVGFSSVSLFPARSTMITPPPRQSHRTEILTSFCTSDPFGEGFSCWPLIHQGRLRFTLKYSTLFSTIVITDSNQWNLFHHPSRLCHAVTRSCLFASFSSCGSHFSSLLMLSTRCKWLMIVTWETPNVQCLKWYSMTPRRDNFGIGIFGAILCKRDAQKSFI